MEGDFRIGDWLVQPRIGIVTNGGRSVHVEPKVMDVLVYLARNADDVLPKERIIQAVWGDTFVTDEVVTNAISELRKAFGDDAKDPHTIQTLPRLGYRVIAKVTRSEQDQPGAADPASGHSWRQRLLVALAAFLLPGVSLVLWWNTFSEPEGPIDSIAVLAFVNVSGDLDSEYLSDGIPKSISSKLSRLPQLRLKPTSVLTRYRGREAAPQTVSEELGVRAVLIGSVERRGDTLIVRADLIDGKAGLLIWSRRYSRKLTDILTVESDIAHQIAEGLRLQLNDEERDRLSDTGTKNSEAYQAHLRGNYHHEREEFREAVKWNEQAVALDRDYQEAWDSLGWHNLVIGLNENSREHYSKARASWERVVEIDDSTVLAHWCKAWLLLSFERDWVRAETEFLRAVDLDPGFGRPTGTYFYFYEAFLSWMGRTEDRLALIETQLERADPLSALQQVMPGYAFLWGREYDRAIEQAEKALALDARSIDAYVVLAESYDRKGMSKEAFEAIVAGQKLRNRSEEELSALQRAFEEEGMRGVRRRLLNRRLSREDSRLLKFAHLYASLGDKDQAFEWLEQAWEQPLWGYEDAPSSCTWDSLRDDPRFELLLRKLNLPEEVIKRHLAAR